ncbi:MAG: hypothetical protein Greene07144_887 [Parcubacteria group bacterium Greene0714_4]|nr:MAG: hypothetical protein Greene07144_887 [Parcubacteria group bacterium Greene0714_4]
MSILDKNEKGGASMGMYTALAGVLLILIALFAPMSKEPRDTYTYTPPPPPASIIVDPIPAKNATSAPHSPEPALITPPQPIKQPEKSGNIGFADQDRSPGTANTNQNAVSRRNNKCGDAASAC